MDTLDLNTLAEVVESCPAPDSCLQIEQLLLKLPPWSSFLNTSPKPEQKQALELLKEKAASPTAEEILFMARIGCGRYHRIRRDGNLRCVDTEKAEALYRQYYELTGSEEVKYILDHFDAFVKLCVRSVADRQRKDEFDPYRELPYLSTSRDPDSDEWKKGV